MKTPVLPRSAASLKNRCRKRAQRRILARPAHRREDGQDVRLCGGR